MKFLTDSEILKWGSDLNLNLTPLYSHITGQPDIVLSRNITNINLNNINSSRNEIENQIIKYRFSFSVSQNRVGDFFRILENLKSYKLGTRFITDRFPHDGKNNRIDSSSVVEIEMSDSMYKSYREEHEIWNRNFVRFTYEFNCHFTGVIAHITYLTDAIDYVAMIWGYNEEGEEIKLLKHNIGDIVSPVTDKSIDLIILDYHFTKRNNEKVIDYVLSEIKGDKNSTIIKYGNSMILSENQLAYSRNNRIDNILN